MVLSQGVVEFYVGFAPDEGAPGSTGVGSVTGVGVGAVNSASSASSLNDPLIFSTTNDMSEDTK